MAKIDVTTGYVEWHKELVGRFGEENVVFNKQPDKEKTMTSDTITAFLNCGVHKNIDVMIGNYNFKTEKGVIFDRRDKRRTIEEEKEKEVKPLFSDLSVDDLELAYDSDYDNNANVL